MPSCVTVRSADIAKTENDIHMMYIDHTICSPQCRIQESYVYLCLFSFEPFFSLCIVLQSDPLTYALGDVYTMATYSQAVNVFGAVKTSKLGAVMDPVGQVAVGVHCCRDEWMCGCVWYGVVVGEHYFFENSKKLCSLVLRLCVCIAYTSMGSKNHHACRCWRYTRLVLGAFLELLLLHETSGVHRQRHQLRVLLAELHLFYTSLLTPAVTVAALTGHFSAMTPNLTAWFRTRGMLRRPARRKRGLWGRLPWQCGAQSVPTRTARSFDALGSRWDYCRTINCLRVLAFL